MNINISGILCLSAVLVSGCEFNDETAGQSGVSGGVTNSRVSELSSQLDVQINGNKASRLSGELPVATLSNDEMSVIAGGDKRLAPGDLFQQNVQIESSVGIAAVLLQLSQSGEYFRLPLSSSKLLSAYNVAFTIPQGTEPGEFCMRYAAEAPDGQVSQPTNPQCVSVTLTNATMAPSVSPAPTATPQASETPATSATPASTNAPAQTATPNPTSTPAASSSPVPTNTPASTPGTGASAADCFNPQLLTPGTQTEFSYRSTTSQGSVEFTDLRTVIGTTMFEGQDAIETVGSGPSSANGGGFEADSEAETKTYSQMDENVPQAQTLGSETHAETQSQGFTITTDSRSVFSPAKLDRFNLQVNESYSQQYSVATETTTETGSFGSNTVNTQGEFDVTTTYLGRESVTVPAGTFDSCRIQTMTTTTVNGDSMDSQTLQFIGVNNGVLIRQVSDDTTTELLSGTINGVAIQ